jgi:hypothetical protein
MKAKELKNITEAEVKEICRLAKEPYISYMTNNDGKWSCLDGLEIQIITTTTMNHASKDDSYLSIYKNGKVSLWRNNGDWNGHRYEEINALPITDYLRERGYKFV